MSRPSATAALVARRVAFQSRHTRHAWLVPAASAELASRFATASGLKVWRGDSPLHRMVVGLMERLVVPGLTLHYVLRKRRIEEIARKSGAEGFRQLVALGAGFDSLALRLAEEMPELHAVEVDLPETQNIKRSVAGPRERVTFVPAALGRDPLPEKLRGFVKPSQATLFLAEAVFLYLSPDRIHRVLSEIRLTCRPARVVFTFFGRRRFQANFRNATPLAALWLRWKGERVLWSIDPGDVAQFVAADGYRLVSIVRDEEYHQGLAAARGEHIAVVEAE